MNQFNLVKQLAINALFWVGIVAIVLSLLAGSLYFLVFFAGLILFNFVIVNLLSNSIKFTAQGFVKLDIKFDLNNTILIVVEDSGIGINSKNLGIIFEPFKQINSDYPNKGMGLGLTIVKYVVKLLNGNIEVKSSEGKGTSFFVFIPVKRVS